MKIKNIILMVTLLLACASCGQNEADGTEDSAETVADMHGILSYYPDYGMWGITISISGTIDVVNLYLIRDFRNADALSKESVGMVKFSGKYYPSDRQSPLGGQKIFYIDITALNYE
jgi:hypothetical protein